MGAGKVVTACSISIRGRQNWFHDNVMSLGSEKQS